MRHGSKIGRAKQVILFAVCILTILVSTLSACVSPTQHLMSIPTVTSIQQNPVETSTPYLTFTPRPTMTIVPTPTLDNLATLASEFDVPGVCLFTYLLSKDKNWIGADCKLYKELIIADKSSGKQIIVPYQDLVDDPSSNFSVRPLSWSSDNRYFYFTDRCCEYDDIYNSNGSLYQFDIQKETWSILVHAVYEPYYYFSEEGERYIFLNHHQLENSGYPEHLEIGMADILLNKNKRVVLKYYWGPFYDIPKYAWSKNGALFAIVLDKIIAIHSHTLDTEKVLLKIDFNRWEMELIEEFNPANLLGEN